MTNLKGLILVAATLFISACTSIPLSTMYKMMNFSPLEFDPRELVVAVKVPHGMKVRTGDLIVDFGFKAKDVKDSFKHQFLVQVSPNYQLPPELAKEVSLGDNMTILQLSKEDALTMYNGQQAVRKYRENSDDGAGSFGLKIESACRDENFSINDSKLNIYVKLEKDEEFFIFTQDLELVDMSGALEKIPSCS